MTEQIPPVPPRKKGGSPSIMAALALIIAGGYFLLRQFGLISGSFNWWALFILIPAFGSFGSALTIFRRNGGRLTAGVLGPLTGGFVTLTVAAMFLLDLDWGIYWPLMILIPGISSFLSGLLGFGVKSKTIRTFVSLSTWIGLGMIVLASGFLTKNLGIYNPAVLFPGYNWWAIPIAIPGVGAVLSTLFLLANDERPRGAVLSMIITAVVLFSVAGVAFIAQNGQTWNMLTPLILIGVGVIVLINNTFKRKPTAE